MAAVGNPYSDCVQWYNDRSTEHNLFWELAFLLMVTIAQTHEGLGSKVISLPLLIRLAWIKEASSLTVDPYHRIVLYLHLHTVTPCIYAELQYQHFELNSK